MAHDSWLMGHEIMSEFAPQILAVILMCEWLPVLVLKVRNIH